LCKLDFEYMLTRVVDLLLLNVKWTLSDPFDKVVYLL
jgi:hypothetical protein